VGLLETIATNDHSARVGQVTQVNVQAITTQASTTQANTASQPNEPSTPATPATPSSPCPACSSTTYWLDAYERWHCWACQPPLIKAMAKRAIRVRPNAEGVQGPQGQPPLALRGVGAGERRGVGERPGPDFGPPIDLGEHGIWYEFLPARRQGRVQFRRDGFLSVKVHQFG